MRDINFNDNSIVIKVTKELNKSFVSLGSWIEDKEKDELKFKIFSKLQLIDFDKNKRKFSYDDITSYKILVFDNCENRINVKIYLNENRIPNEITSDLFIPHIGKYKIMISGIGDSVMIKQIISNFSKRKNISYEHFNDRGNCTCCSIY